MIHSLQFTSRQTLDVIVKRTIAIYRWAVVASFTIIGIGFLIAIVADQQVETEMSDPLTIASRLFDLQASGFFGAGISVMVLTPIVMIAIAAVTFFRAGDQRYGLITSAVAAILSLSIAISFVIG